MVTASGADPGLVGSKRKTALFDEEEGEEEVLAPVMSLSIACAGTRTLSVS